MEIVFQRSCGAGSEGFREYRKNHGHNPTRMAKVGLALARYRNVEKYAFRKIKKAI
jgi:hypothetical protein